MDVTVAGRQFRFDRPTREWGGGATEEEVCDRVVAVNAIPPQFQSGLEWAEYWAPSHLLTAIAMHKRGGVWGRSHMATRGARIIYSTLRCRFILDARDHVGSMADRLQLPPCTLCGAQTVGVCPYPRPRPDNTPQICGRPCCRDCQVQFTRCMFCESPTRFPLARVPEVGIY